MSKLRNQHICFVRLRAGESICAPESPLGKLSGKLSDLIKNGTAEGALHAVARPFRAAGVSAAVRW